MSHLSLLATNTDDQGGSQALPLLSQLFSHSPGVSAASSQLFPLSSVNSVLGGNGDTSVALANETVSDTTVRIIYAIYTVFPITLLAHCYVKYRELWASIASSSSSPTAASLHNSPSRASLFARIKLVVASKQGSVLLNHALIGILLGIWGLFVLCSGTPLADMNISIIPAVLYALANLFMQQGRVALLHSFYTLTRGSKLLPKDALIRPRYLPYVYAFVVGITVPGLLCFDACYIAIPLVSPQYTSSLVYALVAGVQVYHFIGMPFMIYLCRTMIRGLKEHALRIEEISKASNPALMFGTAAGNNMFPRAGSASPNPAWLTVDAGGQEPSQQRIANTFTRSIQIIPSGSPVPGVAAAGGSPPQLTSKLSLNIRPVGRLPTSGSMDLSNTIQEIAVDAADGTGTSAPVPSSGGVETVYGGSPRAHAIAGGGGSPRANAIAGGGGSPRAFMHRSSSMDATVGDRSPGVPRICINPGGGRNSAAGGFVINAQHDNTASSTPQQLSRTVSVGDTPLPTMARALSLGDTPATVTSLAPISASSMPPHLTISTASVSGGLTTIMFDANNNMIQPSNPAIISIISQNHHSNSPRHKDPPVFPVPMPNPLSHTGSIILATSSATGASSPSSLTQAYTDWVARLNDLNSSVSFLFANAVAFFVIAAVPWLHARITYWSAFIMAAFIVHIILHLRALPKVGQSSASNTTAAAAATFTPQLVPLNPPGALDKTSTPVLLARAESLGQPPHFALSGAEKPAALSQQPHHPSSPRRSTMPSGGHIGVTFKLSNLAPKESPTSHNGLSANSNFNSVVASTAAPTTSTTHNSTVVKQSGLIKNDADSQSPSTGN